MAEKELSKKGALGFIAAKTARRAARIAVKLIPIKKKPFNKEAVRDIVIIQKYGMGDFLMSSPAIGAIALGFPKAKIRVLCKGFVVSIAKMTAGVDNAFSDELQFKNPDLVVSLNDSVEASTLVFKKNPPYFIGYLKGNKIEANFPIESGLCADYKKSWMDNYLLVPKALKISKIPNKNLLKIKKSLKTEKIIKKAGNFIIINPNTREGAEAKNWGNDNYARLCKMLGTKYSFVFCGEKGEENSKAIIASLPAAVKKKSFDITGRLSLKELTRLFSKARLFIGNDSGPMHIALSVNCPTIGIFGPTNSKILFPKKKNSIPLQVKNKEWPCYIRGTFDIKPNTGYMDSIKPELVVKKAKKLLKGGKK